MAQTAVSESPLGKTITLRIQMESRADGCKAMLIAAGHTKSNDYGTVNTLLLVEFGAGVHYNPSDNPKAGEMGYGVGTFLDRFTLLRMVGITGERTRSGIIRMVQRQPCQCITLR